jgi:acetolactate synthase-1/3 small subunit
MEVTGTPDKLDGFLDVLRPFGILEMVSTGAVAMTRGARRIPSNTAFPRLPTDSIPPKDDPENFAA